MNEREQRLIDLLKVSKQIIQLLFLVLGESNPEQAKNYKESIHRIITNIERETND